MISSNFSSRRSVGIDAPVSSQISCADPLPTAHSSSSTAFCSGAARCLRRAKSIASSAGTASAASFCVFTPPRRVRSRLEVNIFLAFSVLIVSASCSSSGNLCRSAASVALPPSSRRNCTSCPARLPSSGISAASGVSANVSCRRNHRPAGKMAFTAS